MAKVQIKSEKLTPFGGIFSIMEQFDSMLSPIIDQTLGQRCRSIIGYQYSEIIRSLMSVYFCGGSCVEDVTSHLMRHLSYHPTLRTCSSDTILRAIKELLVGRFCIILLRFKELMVKVNIVFLNFLQLACRNQSVYKQCVEFVCSIEIIGLALVGSIGDVFLCQFLDGSEDGIRAACTKGRMIREMAHQL